MHPLPICVDVGTTRIKAAVFSKDGEVVAEANTSAPSLGDWRGFLSFDAGECVESVCRTLREIKDALGPDAVVHGIVVTSQRATVVPVGREGHALCPALSWQDPSADLLMSELAERIGPDRFSMITGLPPSALWSLAKILRLRRDVPEVFQRTFKFLTLHDFILKALGAERFITDASNASVTGMMDLKRLAWSDEILAAAELPLAVLPTIVPSSTVCGNLNAEKASRTGIREEALLLVGGGDQQCATIGIGATEQGDAALCLGTAAVLNCPVEKPMPEAAGKFFCTAHVLENRWVLEGIHNAFAGSLEWTGSVLGMPSAPLRERALQESPPGARGVSFFPFLSGIGSPDYDAACAGTFLGLRPTHTAADLMRAVYEGIVMETRRVVESVSASVPLKRLFVGGGFATGTTGQLLADLLGREIVITTQAEASLLGAAVLGSSGLGFPGGLRAALEQLVKGSHTSVLPRERGAYTELYESYKTQIAVLRSLYARRHNTTAQRS